jgi:hypothetical protein
LAGTRAQSGNQYVSGTLHSGQVLRGSLPLLSPEKVYNRKQWKKLLKTARNHCILHSQWNKNGMCYVRLNMGSSFMNEHNMMASIKIFI